MTTLNKRVTREMRHQEKGRPVIVTLSPGDMITFRLKGLRKTYSTSLAACLWLAIKSEANTGKKVQR